MNIFLSTNNNFIRQLFLNTKYDIYFEINDNIDLFIWDEDKIPAHFPNKNNVILINLKNLYKYKSNFYISKPIIYLEYQLEFIFDIIH